MAQSFIAGGTSYENQSLTDIIKDITSWIEYSEEVKAEVVRLLAELKNTKFYKNISYEYRAMILEMPQICQTNIDDLKRTLESINSHTLTQGKVELFRKVGVRAFQNSDDNKKYFKLRDDGYWHDYGNPEFAMVETIYAMFGDYCATLWDISNAASRLKDYIDIPKEITSMKIEDNSINIGDGNKIKKSNFHSKNKTKSTEGTSSKIFWNIIIPIIVGVAVIAIGVALGLN